MNIYKLSKKVQISETGKNKYIVFNSLSDETYEIGYKEYYILSLIDGNNTIDAISEKCEFFTKSEISALIKEFEKLKMVTPNNKESAVIPRKKFNIFKIKFKILAPNSFIKPESTFVSGIANFLTYVSIPVSVICFFMAFLCDKGIFAFKIGDLTWKTILVYAIITDVFLAVHEFSHAIVARHYNLSVAEIGVMLYLFIPVAYTNINGLTVEKSKRKKLYSLAAGMLSNLFLATIFLLIATLIQTETLKTFFILCFYSNALIIFFNCLIFIKYDGYYIFQILLEETFLREKAFYHLLSIFDKKKDTSFTGKGIIRNEDTLSEKMFFIVFGVASIIFVPILLFFYIVI